MPSKALDFALVIHNHQPIGNEDGIIETIYLKSYSPFLRKLAEWPEIKVNIHYSGYLLEWMAERHPDFIKQLKTLVDRNQVEMIGGGYYEPILPVIPERDAISQIEILKSEIEKLLGQSPLGFWTAERAWEPQLPEVLQKSGVKYTLLDDTIFSSVGLGESGWFEPYFVESRGYSVVVFPMLKRLRYNIPFKPVSTTISYLGSINASTDGLAVYADDGEKFGSWPTTYEHVYTNGWLDGFFRAIAKNKKWLNTVRLSDYLVSHNPRRRIYLPTSAYEEMTEWSIPVSKDNTAKAGQGFWRLFLAKYPESARLYQKMIRVSAAVAELQGEARNSALSELLKGQSNDAYWHGVFGGLYSPLLRRETYCHLIRAQMIAEASGHESRAWIDLQKNSFNGRSEYSFDSPKFGVTFALDEGGAVAELDYKPLAINLIDTLARRRERYHDKVRRYFRKHTQDSGVQSIHKITASKQQGLDRMLQYDRFPRYAFLDHLLVPDCTERSFADQTYQTLADLAGERYSFGWKRTPRGISCTMNRRAASAGEKVLVLEKEANLSSTSSEISILYKLRMIKGLGHLEAKFAVELNLGSLWDAGFRRRFARKNTIARFKNFGVDYEEMGVSVDVSCSVQGSLWVLPVKTVSQSESGFESILQGVCLVPNFEIDLGKQEAFEVEITLKPRTT